MSPIMLDLEFCNIINGKMGYANYVKYGCLNIRLILQDFDFYIPWHIPGFSLPIRPDIDPILKSNGSFNHESNKRACDI